MLQLGMRQDLARRVVFRGELKILRDDVCECLLHCGAGEGRVAECHLVQQNTKGPEVDGGRRAAAIDNFR